MNMFTDSSFALFIQTINMIKNAWIYGYFIRESEKCHKLRSRSRSMFEYGIVPTDFTEVYHTLSHSLSKSSILYSLVY